MIEPAWVPHHYIRAIIQTARIGSRLGPPSRDHAIWWDHLIGYGDALFSEFQHASWDASTVGYQGKRVGAMDVPSRKPVRDLADMLHGRFGAPCLITPTVSGPQTSWRLCADPIPLWLRYVPGRIPWCDVPQPMSWECMHRTITTYAATMARISGGHHQRIMDISLPSGSRDAASLGVVRERIHAMLASPPPRGMP